MSELKHIPQEVLDRYRDKWLAVGLCTDPMNFEEAKKAARLAYELAGHQCPDLFFRCDSPIQGVVFSHLCLEDREHELHALAELSPQERLAWCTDFIQKNKEVNFSPAFNSFAFGNHDVAWLAYYEVLEKEAGIEYCSKLRGLQDLAHHCGWWSPFDRAVVFQERPCEIHLVNDELHNDAGPAVLYPDGYAVWSINGVTLPPKDGEVIVMRPQEQSLESITSEENAEVKRIRIERFGWENFLLKANATVVDHRVNEIEQTEEALMECDGLRVLVCACPSTARVYAMEVPAETQTCRAAQAWLSSDLSNNMCGAS